MKITYPERVSPDQASQRFGSWTSSVADDLSLLRSHWEEHRLSDAAYATAFFLLWQIHQHGQQFASRIQRNQPRPDAQSSRNALLHQEEQRTHQVLAQYLAQHRFFRVSPSITLALQGWLVKQWPLRLMTRIPPPREVLSMQTQGVRPVTLINEFPKAHGPILSKRNAFDFLCHDLEHAAKFCANNDQLDRQIAYFRRLEILVNAPFFARLLRDNVFHEKIDYLISDMNTHPIHGLYYLHAVLIERVLHEEGKTTSDRLSETGRSVLSALMGKIASLWEFDEQGTHAMIRLTSGHLEELDAQHLEIMMCR